jgi:hypothetical protein
MRTKASDEAFGLVLGKAIQKKVCCDQIVAGLRRLESTGVGAVCSESMAFTPPCDARFEEPQHRPAGIDGVGGEVGSGQKQAREESPVSIAEDEGAPGLSERRKMIEAAVLQHGTEGEVLHRLVDPRDALKTRRPLPDQR